ncbi:hypothetical protein [Burkholderia multivorans]|uniref:hypothetical protein n=1 Tax=Burkholderia multivorans TaxID=87883 RepID=UPI0021C17937|nr:hypothetical protein [Burkholderia multivorans]MDR8763913.1 hypothetical protein [Burkholderia multivorans]MDR8769578.1 hypothetical protein [Burkholderia multivorans]MDR8775222.1 hypothetical protein [Burkholderia multivorans]MDR8793550.1 hypothetical protein [Burkholderia multivorans]MDR8799235.1 hypothetical protein [Burkholderia multivorans]
MTEDEVKVRIDVLHDEAAAILAEQGLSPLRAYCLILEQVTVRHEPTLRLLADAAAHDQWFREQVREGLKEADDPNTKWVYDDEAQQSYARKRAELLARIGKGNA